MRKSKDSPGRFFRIELLCAVLALTGSISVRGQSLHTNQFQPTAGRTAAPIDVTGYWVALITEDWRYRMLTPLKGDYYGVPLNLAAKKLADAWDPAKDEARGEQCKSYGAPAIMRVPGRIHISWANDDTLRVEMDNGQQTRLFHFGGWTPPVGSRSTWQGESIARWTWPGQTLRADTRGSLGLRAFTAGAIGAGEFGAGIPAAPPAPPTTGSLTVLTTHLRAGYLRKNGVPYSANAVVTEYYDLAKPPKGDQWLTVTTIVDDPEFLEAPFITSTHFRKQPDGGMWTPEACSSR